MVYGDGLEVVRMDLSSPGSDLLGPNETAVLRVLAHHGHPLTGRDVARLAETSPSSTRRALLRLERVGLVRSRESSHARLVELQRDHVLWEPVRAILTAPKRVREAIAEMVATRLGQGTTAAVFGSVARGDSDGDSDVDLALVVADDVTAEERDSVVDDLTRLVESRTGNPAQVLVLTRSALARMVEAGDPLVRSWSDDAVTLTGPRLKDLLSR